MALETGAANKTWAKVRFTKDGRRVVGSPGNRTPESRHDNACYVWPEGLSPIALERIAAYITILTERSNEYYSLKKMVGL